MESMIISPKTGKKKTYKKKKTHRRTKAEFAEINKSKRILELSVQQSH